MSHASSTQNYSNALSMPYKHDSRGSSPDIAQLDDVPSRPPSLHRLLPSDVSLHESTCTTRSGAPSRNTFNDQNSTRSSCFDPSAYSSPGIDDPHADNDFETTNSNSPIKFDDFSANDDALTRCAAHRVDED
eukprot:gene3759-14305_t